MSNKLRRIISLLVTLTLIVSSIVPINAYENGQGSGYGYTSGGGGGGSSASLKYHGGMRFSLLFLSGEQNGSSILDSVGNVNINLWEDNIPNVKIIGNLDVYYGNNDSRQYMSFGNAMTGETGWFYLDKLGKNRNIYTMAGDNRHMASTASLGLSDFVIPPNESKKNITDLLVRYTGEEPTKVELYPENPEGQRIVNSPAAELTDDCQKIITELCKQSGLIGTNAVYCETAPMNEGKTFDNSFEAGTYNGETGNYRLIIEPYSIIKPGSGYGYMAMTLRDCMWYYDNIDPNINTSSFAYNQGNEYAGLAKYAYMPLKDICNINKDVYWQGEDLSTYNGLPEIDYGDGKSIRKTNKILEELEKNHGYGIASISSEIVKRSKAHDMYIGSISHLFLPGTIGNTDPVAYSMEYAGDKVSSSALNETATLLVKSVKDSGIDTLNLAKIDDDATYKSLTDKVVKQLEKEYSIDEYSSTVRALAKDVIQSENFKEFLKATIINNTITIEFADAAETTLADTPDTEWLKMLILQTYIDNNDFDDSLEGTALSITSSDMSDSKTYNKLGFRLLDETDQSSLESKVADSDNYKTAYDKIATTDNSYFGKNRITSDKVFEGLFSGNNEITQGNGAKFIRKPVYIGYTLLDIGRLNSNYDEVLDENSGNDIEPYSADYNLVKMRYNFIGDIADMWLEKLGVALNDSMNQETNTEDALKELNNKLIKSLGLDNADLSSKFGALRSAFEAELARNGASTDSANRVSTIMTNLDGGFDTSKQLSALQEEKISALRNSLSKGALYGEKSDKNSEDTGVWSFRLDDISTNAIADSVLSYVSLVSTEEDSFISTAMSRAGLPGNTIAGFESEESQGEFAIYNGLLRTHIDARLTKAGGTTDEYMMSSSAFGNGSSKYSINNAAFYNTGLNNKGSLINAVNNYVLNNTIAQSGDKKSKIAPSDGKAGSWAEAMRGNYGQSQVIWGTAMPVDILYVTMQEKEDGVELVPLDSLTDNNDYTIVPEAFWVTPGFDNMLHINTEFNVKGAGEKNVPVKVISTAMKPAAIDSGKFLAEYSAALEASRGNSNAVQVPLSNTDLVDSVSGENIDAESFLSKVLNTGLDEEFPQTITDYSNARRKITDVENANFGNFAQVSDLDSKNQYYMVPTMKDKSSYMDDPENCRLQMVCVVKINDLPPQYNFIEDENGDIVEIVKVPQDRDESDKLHLEKTVSSALYDAELKTVVSSKTDTKPDKEEERYRKWDADVIPSIPERKPEPDGEITPAPEEISSSIIPTDETVYVRYVTYPPQYNVYRNADGSERVERVPQNWSTYRGKEILNLDGSKEIGTTYKLNQWLLNYRNDTGVLGDEITDPTTGEIVGFNSRDNIWEWVKEKIGDKVTIGTGYSTSSMKGYVTTPTQFKGNWYGTDPKNLTKGAYNRVDKRIEGMSKEYKNTVYVLYVEEVPDMDNVFHLILPQDMLTRRISYKDVMDARYTESIKNGVAKLDTDALNASKTFYLNLVGGTVKLGESHESSLDDKTEVEKDKTLKYKLKTDMLSEREDGSGYKDKFICGNFNYNYNSSTAKSYNYEIGLLPVGYNDSKSKYQYILAPQKYEGGFNEFGWYSNIRGKVNVSSELKEDPSEYFDGDERYEYISWTRKSSSKRKDYTGGKGPWAYAENFGKISPNKLGYMWTENTKYFNVYGDKDSKYVPYIVIWRGNDRPTLVNDYGVGGIQYSDVSSRMKGYSKTQPGFMSISDKGFSANSIGSYGPTFTVSGSQYTTMRCNKNSNKDVVNNGGNTTTITRALPYTDNTNTIVDGFETTVKYGVKSGGDSGSAKISIRDDKEAGGYRAKLQLFFGAASGSNLWITAQKPKTFNNKKKGHWHSHYYRKNNSIEGADGNFDAGKEFISKNLLTGFVHVRSFIGPQNQGIATGNVSSVNSFKIGNNEYKSENGADINKTIFQLSNFDFYPYVTMRYETSDPSQGTQKAKVWSELKSTIKGSDALLTGVKLPVGTDSTGGVIKGASGATVYGRLNLESDMWSTHKKAATLSSAKSAYRNQGLSGSIKVLPGGAIYRLKCGAGEFKNGASAGTENTYPNNTKVGIKGYFTYVPDDSLINYTLSDAYKLSAIETAYSKMAKRAQVSLETVDILQYIQDNGTNRLPTNDANKYNLKQAVDPTSTIDGKLGMEDGDMNGHLDMGNLQVINKPNIEGGKYYRVWSEVDSSGKFGFFLARGNTASEIATLAAARGKIIKTVYPADSGATSKTSAGINSVVNGLIGSDKEVKELDGITKIITNYVSAVDFGRGSAETSIIGMKEYKSENDPPGSLTIKDDNTKHWYNEESPGICAVIKETEYVLGLGPSGYGGTSGGTTPNANNKSIRTAATNPVDTPAKANSSDTYSKAYVSWFQTDRHSYENSKKGLGDGFLSEFALTGITGGKITLNMPTGMSYDRLYRTENFLIPNATVMDLA